jgi:CRP-like cAMP-binding protein
MDHHANLLLAAEKLRKETGLLRGQKVRGTFAYKRIASQTYLVVNSLQARVLNEFATTKTVPQALENCIRERTCIPLREFYDLILKAHRAGILRSEELCAEGPGVIERPPVRWCASLNPRLTTLLVCFAAVAAVGILFWWREPAWSIRWPDLLAGWLAVCGALGLGQVLAASALRGAGGEVHRPHFRWQTLAPHFAVDLGDACMCSLLGRAVVLAVSVLPLALTTAVALWLRQTWSLVPLAALFLACRPVGNSPVRNLLLLLRRRPLLSTDSVALFKAPLTLAEHWRAAWQRFDGYLALTQFVASIGWAAGLAGCTYRLLHIDPTTVFANRAYWEKALLAVGLILAALALLCIMAEIQHRIVGAMVGAWHYARLLWRRWRPGCTALDVDAIESLIRRNVLLGQLDPEVQRELAQCFRLLRARVWRTLAKLDEESPFVGMIVSGRAAVYRRLKSGRKAKYLEVLEGDLFGANRLMSPDHTSLEVRTLTPFVALTLSAADFQRLVVDKLGVPVVAAYLQKHLFLQRGSTLCADWRPAAIARFVDLAATSTHAAGHKIISRGQEVRSLYVLCEGRARAFADGKRIGTLEPGDFFGEISLLQTSSATADIETKEDARSLVVTRPEFIRFMSHNHHVALQMERLCSKRLGRPIFPFDRYSFDAR